MSKARQRLTLCMIVRDEEAMLPDCLASVRGVVDDMVVVDTGSSDRTVELAEAAGARVVHFAWCDDFAAARNAGLAVIERGFVLVLDADERLAPGARSSLKRILRKPDFDCGLLPLHDAAALDASPQDVVAGRARLGEPILVPRLLRRTPDLAYRGIVHESVSDWVERGRVLRGVDVGIVHYGAVPSLRLQRGKSERNLRLLELRCAAEPEAAVARTYLARELMRAGQPERARSEAARAWRALASDTRGTPGEDVVMVASMHAFLELTVDHFDEAAAVLTQAREWTTEHPNLDLLAGVLFERMSCVEPQTEGLLEALLTARDAFRRCLEQHGKAFSSELLPGATSWAAATRLGTIELALGQHEAALRAFDAALCDSPDPTEAQLGRLEALIDQGQAQAVLGDLEPWLAADTPDAWTLAAAAAEAIGSPADRVLFAERARAAAARTSWIGARRVLRLAALSA